MEEVVEGVMMVIIIIIAPVIVRLGYEFDVEAARHGEVVVGPPPPH